MCTKTKCVQKSNFLVCIFFNICNKFELLTSQGSAGTYLRCGEQYYTVLLNIFILYSAVKEF